MNTKLFLTILACLSYSLTQAKKETSEASHTIPLASFSSETQNTVKQLISEQDSFFGLKPLKEEDRFFIASALLFKQIPQCPPSLSGCNEKLTLYHREIEKNIQTSYGILYAPHMTELSVAYPHETEHLIIFLRENSPLVYQLEGILKEVKKAEEIFLQFWIREPYVENAFIQELYYPPAHPYALLNYSASWQQFCTSVRHSMCVVTPFAVVGAAYGLSVLVFGSQKVHHSLNQSPGSIGGMVGCSLAPVVEKCIKDEQVFCSLLTYLHRKTKSAATMAHALYDLQKLFARCPELLKITSCCSIFSKTPDEPLDFLLKLLQLKTFKGESTIFSHRGNVRAAYALMNELKDEFIPYLLAIGELDSCIALMKSQLIKPIPTA